MTPEPGFQCTDSSCARDKPHPSHAMRFKAVPLSVEFRKGWNAALDSAAESLLRIDSGSPIVNLALDQSSDVIRALALAIPSSCWKCHGVGGAPDGSEECDQCSGTGKATCNRCEGRTRVVLSEIEEYVDNYVDIDWEGRPNWAMQIKVMLEKLP